MDIFCPKEKWDEKAVSQKQREGAFRKAAEMALAEQAPLYLSIDDTVIEKKKPSSQAKRPMEVTGWHYSHLAGIHTSLPTTVSPLRGRSLRGGVLFSQPPPMMLNG